MDTVTPILLFSLLINLLLLRWAFSEYRNRRDWQQEAAMLEKALRTVNADPASRPRNGLTMIWVLGIIAMFLSFAFFGTP